MTADLAVLIMARAPRPGQVKTPLPAVEDVLVARQGPVVVIGTDAPTLSPTHPRQTGAALSAGHDTVFGPAPDGGYYLFALPRVTPELLAIDRNLWGGPQVLSASLTAAETAGLSVGMLAPLRDVGAPADARAFLDDELSAEIADLLHAATSLR